jgi:hypothetical protein
MELKLSAKGLRGLLEGLSKGYDGWLHNSSNVAVVVPPDAAIMPAAVRFELAERCEVVYDDPNLDRLLAGSVSNSHNVAELSSEGFDRGLGDVLGRGEGPRVSLPFRDSEVECTNNVEKSRFYSTQKIQDIKLEQTLWRISPNGVKPSRIMQ